MLNLVNLFCVLPHIELHASLLIVVTNMNAYDVRDLIYILIQCADKSLSISGTLINANLTILINTDLAA